MYDICGFGWQYARSVPIHHHRCYDRVSKGTLDWPTIDKISRLLLGKGLRNQDQIRSYTDGAQELELYANISLKRESEPCYTHCNSISFIPSISTRYSRSKYERHKAPSSRNISNG